MESPLGIVLFMIFTVLFQWDLNRERKKPASKLRDGSGYVFTRPRGFTWMAAGCGVLTVAILFSGGHSVSCLLLVPGALSLWHGQRRYHVTESCLSTRSALGFSRKTLWPDVASVTITGFQNLIFHGNTGTRIKVPACNKGISTVWSFIQRKLDKGVYEGIFHHWQNAAGPFVPPEQ